MVPETDLMTQSWNSAMSEKGGLLQDLLPLLVGSEMKTFSLPKPLDDDGTDISLKDWQLGLRNSVEKEVTAVYPFKPFKGSMRPRFTPIEPWLDHSPRHSSPDRYETAPTTPRTPRTSSSGTRSNSVSPTRLESSYRGDSSLQQLGFTNGDGHHLHNVNVVSGITSPRTSGITFNEVSLKDDAKLDNFNYRARSDRGSSLRVSFMDELEVLRSPSAPEVRNRSPLETTASEVSKDLVGQQSPKWKSCNPSAPSMPKTRVQPTVHGGRPREEIISDVKPRDSTLPLPDIETVYQSHGMSPSRQRESQLRHPSRQARRSLDSIGERTKYHSSSNSISSLPASSYQSRRENTSISDPNSPSFLLRCNGRRQHDEEEDDDDDEDVKVGILCGGGLSDTNISGDFVRLVSKLCRLSVPLPEQSASKPSQQRGLRFARANSIPALISWETQDSGIPCRDYAIIGRQNSLKLLCERCSNGSTPAYDLPKPRKIRDHEPHQHFYKPISKTLDQKLKN